MEMMNYEITDNWVKSIRAYIFTEEYLFFVEQFLDEKCKKDGEPRFSMVVERKYYIHERRGSNIKWGENPGITYSTATNAGQKAERTEVRENPETTSGEMNDADVEEKGANNLMFEDLMDSGIYN